MCKLLMGGEAMRNLHVNIPPVCRSGLRGRGIFVFLKRAGRGRCQSRVWPRKSGTNFYKMKKKKKKVNICTPPWVTVPFPNNNYDSTHTSPSAKTHRDAEHFILSSRPSSSGAPTSPHTSLNATIVYGIQQGPTPGPCISARLISFQRTVEQSRVKRERRGSRQDSNRGGE